MSLEQRQSYCHRCEKMTLHTRNTYDVANACRIFFAAVAFSVGPVVSGVMGILTAVSRASVPEGVSHTSDLFGVSGVTPLVTGLTYLVFVSAGILSLCHIKLGHPPFLCNQCGQEESGETVKTNIPSSTATSNGQPNQPTNKKATDYLADCRLANAVSGDGIATPPPNRTGSEGKPNTPPVVAAAATSHPTANGTICFACTACGKKYKMPHTTTGHFAKCVQCGELLRVPASSME